MQVTKLDGRDEITIFATQIFISAYCLLCLFQGRIRASNFVNKSEEAKTPLWIAIPFSRILHIPRRTVLNVTELSQQNLEQVILEVC